MNRTRWLLFVALFIGSAGFFQPVEYDNTKSRWMLLSAIVDEGKLSIDTLQASTVDKALSRGHYYSIKAPGLPFLAAPVYWTLRRALKPSPLPPAYAIFDPRYRYLLIVAVVALPFALLGLILFEFLLTIQVPPRQALWAVLSYGLGTIALSNADLFSGHQTAAFFIFCAFFVLFLCRRDARRPRRTFGLVFLGGLLAGIGVLCDYIGLCMALPLTVYALCLPVSKSAKAAFIAGAAFCAAALASYNLTCFGSLWTLSYVHALPSSFITKDLAHGIAGVVWPNPMTLSQLLGSPSRGLFFISPVLLFALAGYFPLARRKDLRREFLLCAAAPVVTLLTMVCFYGWHGGAAFGPRYLVVILPFLIIPLALTADGGPWFLVLLGISVLQIAFGQLGFPHVFPDIQNPIIEFIVPLMREGVVALNWIGKTKLVSYLTGGLIQYGIMLVLAAETFRGLPTTKRQKLPWAWSWFLGAWIAYIAAMLAFFRTQAPHLVQLRRATALHETAFMLESPELEQEAKAELARPPGS